MFIKTLAFCTASLIVLATATLAEGRKVVIELYTSQGCSSCPPADELMQKLAKRDDVIALALHVDYWDYIGWKDVFANPAFTKRQKGYAMAAGARSIYTPQMVVGGVDHLVGAKPMELMDLIERHSARPDTVDLTVQVSGGQLQISAPANPGRKGRMVVQLVRYDPSQQVKITRGENAGKTLTYSNIVTSWDRVGDWDGRKPLALSLPFKGKSPGVVIVQSDTSGPILAAAEVR